MQGELESTYPILNIQIVGINEFGQDPAGANDLMTANRTTPWLQDGDSNGNQTSDVWYDKWNVTYRDVIVLNGQNEMTDVYNLTSHDLGVAENYATMRDKLIAAAMTEQKPWQNHRDRFDINDDGFVVANDVLVLINDINANGARDLPPPTTATMSAPFFDTSGDNYFSPIDVLQVINFIEGVDPEGESSNASDSILPAAMIVAPTSTAQTSSEVAPLPAVSVNVPSDVSAFSIVVPPQASSATPLAAERRDVDKTPSDDFWAEYWPSR